ncbi:MAG: hypothetical protein PF505_00620, partial [Vallitaleaceae bacterium]|nr:hypothetical protein [Vallitaleaceae bacterium]
MVDLIMNMIRFLFDAITGFSSLSIVSPATFNVALYNSALDICNNVVKPFGYTLLGALILFELTAITTRTEGIGQHGFEIPMRFIMKVAIVKIFLDKVDVVLLAISDLTSDIITGITYSGTSLTLASGVADMQANI